MPLAKEQAEWLQQRLQKREKSIAHQAQQAATRAASAQANKAEEEALVADMLTLLSAAMSSTATTTGTNSTTGTTAAGGNAGQQQAANPPVNQANPPVNQAPNQQSQGGSGGGGDSGGGGGGRGGGGSTDGGSGSGSRNQGNPVNQAIGLAPPRCGGVKPFGNQFILWTDRAPSNTPGAWTWLATNAVLCLWEFYKDVIKMEEMCQTAPTAAKLLGLLDHKNNTGISVTKWVTVVMMHIHNTRIDAIFFVRKAWLFLLLPTCWKSGISF